MISSFILKVECRHSPQIKSLQSGKTAKKCKLREGI